MLIWFKISGHTITPWIVLHSVQIWVIDQARGQDGWILAKVHNHALDWTSLVNIRILIGDNNI